MHAITIGMEVEANHPHELPGELVEIMEKVRKDCSTFINSNGLYPFSDKQLWQMLRGTSTTAGVYAPLYTSFLKCCPDKYLPPVGWYKDADGSCGLEMRFAEPTDNLKEAHSRIDGLLKWFDRMGVNAFSNAGTHIHLGVNAWLSKQGLHGEIPDRLLFLGFATRENAFHSIIPQFRRNGGYCGSFFLNMPDDKTKDDLVNPRTPAWALHNHAMGSMYNSLVYSSTYPAIRNNYHHPTFEFRHFPGTDNKEALKGYLDFVHHLFQVLANKLLKTPVSTISSTSETIVVNPYTYTNEDLYKELTDKKVISWHKRMVAANGLPEHLSPTADYSEPEAVAV